MSVDKEAIIKKVLEEHKIIRYRDYFRKAMSAAMDEYSSELIKENQELNDLIDENRKEYDQAVDKITQLQSSNEDLKKDLKAYKESFETNKEQFMELATHAKDLEIENSHLRQRLEEEYNRGYGDGYKDATNEARQEIRDHYRPNNE